MAPVGIGRRDLAGIGVLQNADEVVARGFSRVLAGLTKIIPLFYRSYSPKGVSNADRADLADKKLI